MRILQINKFFSIHGGSDTVFFETINGLRERGEEIVEFSMRAPGNLPSTYEKYFVSPVSLRAASLSERWQAMRRLFSSAEVARQLTRLVHDTHPDLAHLHNAYRELSASTFLTLRKLGLPIVLTVHDMFPLVPNHNFLLGETMAEKKLGRSLFNCVRYCCVNNSLSASIVGALEARHYRSHKIWQHIDRFICPSEFMKNKLLEYGFPEEKLRVVLNPCTLPKKILPLGRAIVFLGRLHVEKGIRVFMRAVKDLKNYPVIVAGDGPDRAWVERFIKDNQLTHVTLYGWADEVSKEKLLAAARVVVSPAIFYDLCSLTILEAQACGRLVVASDRGGNPELVANGRTGWLAQPEDPSDLARTIQEAMEAPESQVSQIVTAEREQVAKKHNLDDYLAKIEAIYKELRKG